MSEELRKNIVSLGEKATGIIDRYLSGDEEISDGQINVSLKILAQSNRVMNLDQSRQLKEQENAIKLLKFLPDQKSKRQYIEIMNPTVAGLLVKSRPEG